MTGLGGGIASCRRTHDHDNAVSLGLHGVRVGLIEVKNDAGDGRRRAVLAGADPAHAVGIYFNFGGNFSTHRARQVEEDPVGANRNIYGRLYGGAKRDFDAQVGTLARISDFAHSSLALCSLRHGATH